MPEFEVHVSPEEFDVTGSGSVVGPIWVRIAGTDFPEPGWPDFPAALLGGWLTTLSDLESGGAGSAALHFMEGPYRLDAGHGPAGWTLRALYYDTPEAQVTADGVHALRAPLLAASARVLAACRAGGWHGRDVRHLTYVADLGR